MNWMRLALITIGSGIVTSMTDWLFAGDWLHRRFTYPEVWRQGVETGAIALTSPLPFFTGGALVWFCASLGIHSLATALKLALAVWLIGPLPLILTSAAFMKLHRVFVASYLMGWLVKLVIAAVGEGLFLR